MKLEIPVTEGDAVPDRASVKFEGLTVFKEEFVRPLFKMNDGRRLQRVAHQEGLRQAARRLRLARATSSGRARTERKPDPETQGRRRHPDDGGGQAVLRRQASASPATTTTRDKVIRREVYLNEGDVFNTEALKLSIRRINQLGYFKPMEGAPEHAAEPAWARTSSTSPSRSRSRTATSSPSAAASPACEGTFINASLLDRELPRRGRDVPDLGPERARAPRTTSSSVTEPYLFDRPITAGIDLFRRKITYESVRRTWSGYTQERTGASLVTGFPVGTRSARLLPTTPTR